SRAIGWQLTPVQETRRQPFSAEAGITLAADIRKLEERQRLIWTYQGRRLEDETQLAFQVSPGVGEAQAIDVDSTEPGCGDFRDEFLNGLRAYFLEPGITRSAFVSCIRPAQAA